MNVRPGRILKNTIVVITLMIPGIATQEMEISTDLETFDKSYIIDSH